MKSKKISFIRPDFPKARAIAKDYRLILKNNWFTNFGPFERRLSEELAAYVGHGVHVATVSNATLGLMLAIQTYIGEPANQRNEVLMPAFTFAAGAEMLIRLGFVPVFMDINTETLQPDLLQAYEYYSKNKKKVAGVLFCNTFGTGAPQIAEWEVFCKRNGLPLVIDSAAGLGSLYVDGSRIGWRGDCEVFSFHATKPFAIGEGGAIMSGKKRPIEKIRQLQNFGFNKNREVEYLGTNAKLPELSCAIGLRQLAELDKRLCKRRQVLDTYKQYLQPQGYTFQSNDSNSSLAFISVIAPSEAVAAQDHKRLIKNGIEVRRYYNPPLHQHQLLRKHAKVAGSLKVTDDVCKRIISLPVHRHTTPKTVKRICELKDIR